MQGFVAFRRGLVARSRLTLRRRPSVVKGRKFALEPRQPQDFLAARVLSVKASLGMVCAV